METGLKVISHLQCLSVHLILSMALGKLGNYRQLLLLPLPLPLATTAPVIAPYYYLCVSQWLCFSVMSFIRSYILCFSYHWQLAYTLIHNPDLINYRKVAADHIPEENTDGFTRQHKISIAVQKKHHGERTSEFFMSTWANFPLPIFLTLSLSPFSSWTDTHTVVRIQYDYWVIFIYIEFIINTIYSG